MCRWLAYTGNPIQLETVLFRAKHSLIDQSLHSRMGATTTNGDGFGIGWYGRPDEIPFRYRSVHPAWNDPNLREAGHALECGQRRMLAARHGVDAPLNMTVCVTDGEQIVAVRYSSERRSRSLYHSTSFRHLHELYPHDPRIAEVGDDAFMVVSEPLVDLPGEWEEIPESTAIVVRGADVAQYAFSPLRHAK